MRTRLHPCLAFLLIALSFPAVLLAQFQQPTADELKITADPKAPGAAAVYLNIEEIDNDPLHFVSFYARIKVLTEKGKEQATVELPYYKGYEKVAEIRGRTIHADGTVVPLTGKPEDLLIVKSSNRSGELQSNTKVFTLPSVEVGSILEYYFQFHYGDYTALEPYWEVQRPFYVHSAHFVFTPFKGFMHGQENDTSRHVVDEHGDIANTLVWWPILPQGVGIRTDAVGRYALDVSDVPPMPSEEWMPPLQNFRYKVLFYYMKDPNVDLFWSDEVKRWSKDIDRFAEPTKTIRDAVSGLIAPGDSDLDKARKLYNAVQTLDNTAFSRRRDEAEVKRLKLKEVNRAEDIWTDKSGSGNGLALLYLAMVRAAGLTANAMKVVDREQGIFDRTYLSFHQLGDVIVILNIGGKEIAVDPGEKMCPFQTLHWRRSNAGGFMQGSDNVKTSPSQLYTDNKVYRTGDITLDRQGTMQGTLQFSMIGQTALLWRQFALTHDEAEVKKSFDESLHAMVPEGVEAHVDRFHALDQPDQKLLADISVKGPLGTATSKRLVLPAFFFQTRGAHPFVEQEKRLEPVDMQFGEVVTDQIAYHLSPDLAVEGAPQDAKISWPQHAVFVVKAVPSPGQITLARSLARAFTFATPAEYQDLRAFYQKVAAADQQQFVLAASTTGKGNRYPCLSLRTTSCST